VFPVFTEPSQGDEHGLITEIGIKHSQEEKGYEEKLLVC
jgi:hypothetical protein